MLCVCVCIYTPNTLCTRYSSLALLPPVLDANSILTEIAFCAGIRLGEVSDPVHFCLLPESMKYQHDNLSAFKYGKVQFQC